MKFHPYVASMNGSQPWIIKPLIFSLEDGDFDPLVPTTSATNSTRSNNGEQEVSMVQLEIILFMGMFLALIFIIYAAKIYIRRQRVLNALVMAPTSPDLNITTRRHGVDQSVIEAFPVIGYTAVKILRTTKSPLECAICLSEFVDDDILRLLPGCRHVFHTDCIGLWLENHVTCPVCRSNLSDPEVIAGKRILSMNSEFDDFDISPEMSEHEPKSDDSTQVKENRRAQSITEGWERFTLMLPEQVLKEIGATGKHRRATSVQDYTFQGKASWRDGKLHALFKSCSRNGHSREGADMPTVVEVGETSDTEVPFVEVDLTVLPVHERV